MIQAIDRESIKRICSGQVIVDLSAAVKEMVENSLDSGATSVEIKLKGMGSESIEVCDNGSGIHPSNYANIALKHHTSKLSDFHDLNSVSSFGFRGEALNALCELSGNFTVTTKLSEEEVGCRLSFGRDGRVLSEDQMARTTGTSVTVLGLFEALPVRRGEFVRTIKRHYQKMVRTLQSYAIIAAGVRIVVTNIEKGHKSVVIGTHAGATLSDNISSIFGTIFLSSLIPVSVTLDIDTERDKDDDDAIPSICLEEGDSSVKVSDVSEVERISPADNAEGEKSILSRQCTISGFISRAGVGVGRGDNDRQFLFCNGRPVDLTKFNRVLNEVWRRYEMKQKPACILDIRVPAGTFDVNLTPDKREIVLAHELPLLEKLREAIDKLYSPSRQTFQLSQGIAADQSLFNYSFSAVKQLSKSASLPSTISASQPSSSYVSLLSSSPSASFDRRAIDSADDETDKSLSVLQAKDVDEMVFFVQCDTWSTATNEVREVVVAEYDEKKRRITADDKENNEVIASSPRRVVWTTQSEEHQFTAQHEADRAARDDEISQSTDRTAPLLAPMPMSVPSQDNIQADADMMQCEEEYEVAAASKEENNVERDLIRSYTDSDESQQIDLTSPIRSASETPSSSIASLLPSAMVQLEEEEEDSSPQEDMVPVIWKFDPIDTLKKYRTNKRLNDISPTLQLCSENALFDSSVTEKSDESGMSIAADGIELGTKEAEMRLCRVLAKNDFSKMRIVGQFNLGFIVAELRGDLFILDQHACDEKFRFETLQRTTVIHQQPLIVPLVLESCASEELIILDNVSTFESNGFKLKVFPELTSGKRIHIVAIPFSKHVQFGVDDIHELASLIANSQGADGGSYMSKLMLKNDRIEFTKSVNKADYENNSKIDTEGAFHDDLVRGIEPQVDMHGDVDFISKDLKSFRSGDYDAPIEGASSSSKKRKTMEDYSDSSVDLGSGRDERSSGDFIRIPKLVSMFASRACRSAIMIGTALRHTEMRAVVSKLENIDQPWNCPHGRPTMRHIVDLMSIHRKRKRILPCDLSKFNAYVSRSPDLH